MDVSIVVISKNESALSETLTGLKAQITDLTTEVIVVDASAGALDDIRREFEVTWIDFCPRPDKRVTIPEQRNAGVLASTGRVVAFIDAGCAPEPSWLDTLVAPLLDGSQTVTVGRTLGRGASLYDSADESVAYLDEAPTINLAFLRTAYDQVEGFDESFDYGSDVDFTWRLRSAGHRLRYVPEAVHSHDWGTTRRQLKRAHQYGAARARLYYKHPEKVRNGLRRDPVLFAYPLFLLGLPLTAWRPMRWYPLLLLLPLWRARHQRPFLTVADHLVYGTGALDFLAGQMGRRAVRGR